MDEESKKKFFENADNFSKDLAKLCSEKMSCYSLESILYGSIVFSVYTSRQVCSEKTFLNLVRDILDVVREDTNIVR